MMNNTTTSAIITQIERALKKVTPGKWCAFISQKTNTYAVHTPGDNRCDDIINWPGFDGRRKAAGNAAYIAAVNPENITALLTYVRDLEREKDMREAVPVAQDEINDIIRRFKYEVDHLSDWHHIDEHSCKVDRRDLMNAIDFMRASRAGESNNAQPLNTAKLINKFYERYPLETFSSDSVRAEALGYFMAGAELHCYGDFIHYEGCCHGE